MTNFQLQGYESLSPVAHQISPITELSKHTTMRRLRYVFLLATSQTVVLRVAGLDYVISKENIGCWLLLIFLIFFLLKVGLWHCSSFTKTPQPFFNLVHSDKTPSLFLNHLLYVPQYVYVDGLVRERRNSIANALELRLSCTNSTMCVRLFLCQAFNQCLK